MSFGTAVLLAAGRSQRLGFDKILTPLAGRPVLHYSLDALADSALIREIVLVTRMDLLERMRQESAPWAGRKPVRVVEGGAERRDSVHAGIRAISPDVPIILIHDAARPLITTQMIEQVWRVAEEKGAAVCARPATDTLKRSTPEGLVIETVDRSEFWQMETPQIFRADIVRSAYALVVEKNIPVTDDASAVEAAGHPVHLVASGELNLKITRPGDWALLELWFGRDKGKLVREGLHNLANSASPLVGYLPMLEKYGGNEPKFRDYLAKVRRSTELLQRDLSGLQGKCREWFGGA